MKQLITVGRDGSLTSLRVKPGKGVDLRKMGEVEMKRSSLIEWDSGVQGFNITILEGEFSGLVTTDMRRAADLDAPDESWQQDEGGECAIYFKEYEEAVNFEIELIQALRKKFGAKAVV